MRIEIDWSTEDIVGDPANPRVVLYRVNLAIEPPEIWTDEVYRLLRKHDGEVYGFRCDWLDYHPDGEFRLQIGAGDVNDARRYLDKQVVSRVNERVA